MAELLAARGAVVVDADDLAREAVEPEGPAYDAVVARFGAGVVAPDGTIDRPALAGLVFTDPVARADLEAIVHPAVAAARDRRLAELADGDDVVVAVVPLLVEVGWDEADAIVVVDCPEELAVRRLVEDRGMDEADVRRRLAAQASRGDRLARADYVIVNDGTRDDLAAEIERAWAWMRNVRPHPRRSGDGSTLVEGPKRPRNGSGPGHAGRA